MGRWGKCFSAAHVPLNHKTDAGVTSRLASSKSCLHWLRPTVKREWNSKRSPHPPQITHQTDQSRLCLPPYPPSLPCSALPQPLSTTTRPSASFLSQVSHPPPHHPPVDTHPHTVQLMSHPLSVAAFKSSLYSSLSELWICMSMHIQVLLVRINHVDLPITGVWSAIIYTAG